MHNVSNVPLKAMNQESSSMGDDPCRNVPCTVSRGRKEGGKGEREGGRKEGGKEGEARKACK